MDWTHVTPETGRRMPWKNGGGTTLELAVDPPGASLEAGFRWRLSSAEVASSGPFSAFPGLARWLWLLEGAGFAIDFGPRGRAELREPLIPLRFAGDWPATATLADGPCVDLNLMVDPCACRSWAETLTLAAPVQLDLQAATTLLVVARGTAAAPGLGLDLGPRHLLRLEGPGALSLVPGPEGATLIRMDLDPA